MLEPIDHRTVGQTMPHYMDCDELSQGRAIESAAIFFSKSGIVRALHILTMERGRAKRLRKRVLPGVHIEESGAQFVHRFDNSTEPALFEKGRQQEPVSIQRLCDVFGSGTGTFVDVGANCGVYSVRLGRALKGSVQVISVEPNPDLVKRLAWNVRLSELGDVASIHQFGLAVEAREMELQLNRLNSGEAPEKPLANSTRSTKVPNVQLERLLERLTLGDCLAIKIDVEGYDPEELKPYFENIAPERWPDAILMETEHTQAWSEDLVGMLLQHGYGAEFQGERNTLFRSTASHLS